MESPEEESRDLSDQSAASMAPDENEEAVTVVMVGGDEEDPFAFVGESDEEGEDEEEPARPDLLDDVDGPPARRGRKTKAELQAEADTELLRHHLHIDGVQPELNGPAPVRRDSALPPAHTSYNPADIFLRLLGQETLEELCECTQRRLEQELRNTRVKKVVEVWHIKNWLVILFASTLADFSSWDDFWADDPTGLIGNAFVKTLLSRARFRAFMRWSDIDVDLLTSRFNANVKKAWILGTDLAFDDDLDHFKGHGEVKRMPKKKAKQGIASWRIVSKETYLWHLIWEREFLEQPRGDLKANEAILGDLLDALPMRKKHCIYIDAGLLGGWATVQELLAREHHFIICHAANRPSWLFANGLHRLNVAEGWAFCGNGAINAITWAAPQVNGYKLVNFTTNIPGLRDPDPVDQEKPAVANVYNQHKYYVDLLAARFAHYELPHRTRYIWRHKLMVIIFLAMHNASLIWHASARTDEERAKRSKKTFIRELIRELARPDLSLHPRPSPNILCAVTHERGKREPRGWCKQCHACKHTMRCLTCANQPHLCLDTDCFARWHIRNLRELLQDQRDLNIPVRKRRNRGDDV